jgi:hypothetical protein
MCRKATSTSDSLAFEVNSPLRGGAMERLRKLDVYPKINEDFFTRTTAGGFITLTSSVIMLMLFVAEARLFLRPHVENVLMVDTSRGAKLQVRRRVRLARDDG